MTDDDLHTTGFGPIDEFGDQPQSDFFTWAIIIACLIPWFFAIVRVVTWTS